MDPDDGRPAEGTTHSIETPDGPMRVFEVAGDGPDAPTVLMFPDVLGLHAELLGMARAVGRRGFRCLAPDVYHREDKRAFRGISELAEMLAMGRRLDTARLVEDIRSLVVHATTGPGPDRVGAIGFCRGGSQAVLAAGVCPEQVVSAIAAYPTRLLQETPDTSYAAWFGSIAGEVTILSPGDDPLLPPADLDRLAGMFDDLAIRYQIRVYPDAVHGWNFRSRPEYDAAADRDTWRVAYRAWDRLLRAGGEPTHPPERRVVVGGAAR